MTRLAPNKDLWLECAKRGLTTNPVILSCLQQLTVNPHDYVCVQFLKEEINRNDTRELLNPQPFRRSNPNNTNHFNGIIHLGEVDHTGIRWSIDSKTLTEHVSISGRTGGGKSNLIRLIAQQVLREPSTIIIFDRKLDFIDLVQTSGFLYVMIEDFVDNWLTPPPGVSATIWCSMLSEIMATFFELRISGQLLLSDMLLGLQGGSVGRAPTLRDVASVLSKTLEKSRGGTRDSLYRIQFRLNSLLQLLGNAIASEHAVELPRLLTKSWALGMAGLSSSVQSLCITVYLAKILLYRISNNLRSNKLETLIVIDEASPIFPKSATKKTALLLDYFQQCRAFGIGLILASQSMNLADEIYANTAIKVAVGGFGHGSDYEEFGSAVGMNRAQRDFMRTISRPGAAVVKDIRYPHPFTVQIDKAS